MTKLYEPCALLSSVTNDIIVQTSCFTQENKIPSWQSVMVEEINALIHNGN